MNKNSTGCGTNGATGLAAFIKIVGKGPKLARDLTCEEARTAFELILQNAAEPAQIGAFLIALRIKGETAEETAGFLAAARAASTRFQTDLPLSLELACAHDGKNKSLVLAPFIARALAHAELTILLTGGRDVPTKKGVTVGQVSQCLGWPVCTSQEDVNDCLEKTHVAYFDIAHYCPTLDRLKSLRTSLGLRTSINTIEKLINPAHATHLVTGVFHGPYLQAVAEALRIVGEKNILCTQATEASTDLPLKKRVLCRELRDGVLSEQFEINPAEWNFLRTENPPFGEMSATDVVCQVRAAVQAQSGLIYDALIYNTAALLWWIKKMPDRQESTDLARKLVTENILFV